MKTIRLLILTIFIWCFHGLSAQTAQYPLAEDVSTISGIIKAAYETVSGEQGQPFQLERDRSLHVDKAILSYPREVNGKKQRVVVSLSEYHQLIGERLYATFYEEEVTREVRIFGNIAHVWSTYHHRAAKDGPIEGRGINSIQLVYENDRWWILSWNWDTETEEQPIPATFDRH